MASGLLESMTSGSVTVAESFSTTAESIAGLVELGKADVHVEHIGA